MKKLLLGLGAVLAMGLTACDDDPVFTITMDMANAKVEYSESGVWKGCQDAEAGAFTCSTLQFTHQATASQWGVSWTGFCPSRVSDNSNPNGDFNRAWGSMSKGGVKGEGTPYVVGFWNTMEGENPENPSLKIDLTDGAAFAPQYVYVNNTSLAYYLVQEGNQFSKPFAAGDWFKIQFIGVTEDGKVSAPVEAYLADYRSEKESERYILNEWKMVDLKPLTVNGPVKYIYIQMASSDSGQWGMNTPAYFAIDGLQVIK